jgi:hypothetical protein
MGRGPRKAYDRPRYSLSAGEENAMRPIMKIAMWAFITAALAAPAFAAASDYYLKLGDIKPVLSKGQGGEGAARSGAGKRIEILSWSWGATSNAKYGAVAGAHRNEDLASVNKPVLSKVEGRQHGWMPVAQPLDRGSVRIKVKFPWLDCKAGAAFPDAVLQNDAGRYEFENVLISGCAPDSVTLDYAKVVVRGWDPAKK